MKSNVPHSPVFFPAILVFHCVWNRPDRRKRPERRSSTCLSNYSKSRLVHYLQEVRVESGKKFPYFRWQCVLWMSLEVALSEQSTSQICQSNLCQRWTRCSQHSLRVSDFLCLECLAHVVVPVCLCQLTRIWWNKEPTSRAQRRARNVASSLPYRLVVVELLRLFHVFCEFGNVCLFVLIATMSHLIGELSKGTHQSPGQETCRDVLASV